MIKAVKSSNNNYLNITTKYKWTTNLIRKTLRMVIDRVDPYHEADYTVRVYLKGDKKTKSYTRK